MTQDPDSTVADTIIAAVLALFEEGGIDSVQLREVAKRARVSHTTVYKRFGSRDELILAAVERWMETQVYRPMPSPAPDEPLFDALLRVYRHIFEPWEQNPRMLEVFIRSRLGPGGERLLLKEHNVIGPLRQALTGVDPGYAADLGMILTNVVYAVVARFATGELHVTEIMPTIERTLFRLTTDNTAATLGSPSPMFRSESGGHR